MITIKAKIDLGGNGTFNNTNATGTMPEESIINVSSFLSVLGQSTPPQIQDNLFQLNRSKLGEGGVYVDKLPYVVGRYTCDSFGNFAIPYEITIENKQAGTPLKNLKILVVMFDKENNGHPNSIDVSYWYGSDENPSHKTVTVYDDDANFELKFDEDNILQIDITIANWNKPNSPLILTGIYAIGDFEINSDNLISFEDDILDRSNVEYPAYGLISNSGNLTFIDFDRTALDLITKRILTADKETTVWVENTDKSTHEQICKMAIQSMTYNNDNLQVNMQLKDNLEKMQDITVAGLYVDPTNIQPQRAKWYYEKLYQYTVDAGFDILTFNELDSDTKTVLYNTVIQYPLLDSDTLWNEWTKICELCLCHMCIDNNNKVVLKYSGGN